ncbi:hypothetical protein WJX84_010342 [Apatococcus fuscideae]|uniref:PIH1 N-terminal domain-containing protein n=1 Tax=Apatococcus fuscideae TaxID=2026836 RepID=A0AAW1THC0_9CHLO
MSQRQEPPPEILAALQALQNSEGGLSGREAGPDLLELVNSVQQGRGERPSNKPKSQHVVPEAGFVIKTLEEDGAKLFINVCHARQVPAPGNWSQGKMPPDISAALDKAREGSAADTETVRFPLSMGPLRSDQDHSGEACGVIDVVFNSDVLREAAAFRPLKAFLVELAKEWVTQKTGRQLQAQYKLPKMRYKGSEIQPQDMRMDREFPLVTELSPDDPSFPLLTQRSPSSSRPAKAASQAASAPPSTATAQPASKSSSLQHQKLQGGGADAAANSRTAQPGRHERLEPGEAEAASSQVKPGIQLPAAANAAAGAASDAPVGGRDQQMQHKVLYEGRPVQRACISITFPAAHRANELGGPIGSSAEASSQAIAQSLVEVLGDRVRVATPGFQTLEVTLPLAVTATGAAADLTPQDRSLKLSLPYLPLASFIKQMRAQAPHSFGALPLTSSTYLELEM